MSGLLLLCIELTLFYTELTENCIYLNQSELSNFVMYIINPETWTQFQTLSCLVSWSHFINYQKIPMPITSKFPYQVTYMTFSNLEPEGRLIGEIQTYFNFEPS